MPLVIDRRSFLRASLACGFVLRLRAAESAPSRWALVSDVHCSEDPNDSYRGFYPQANLKKAAKDIADSDATVCAVTGDLARLAGKPGDYEAFKTLFSPVLEKMPVGFALGNHDNRQNFRKAFASPFGVRQPVPGTQVAALEWTDLRAVFLDSLLGTEVTPGQLGSAQRRWLAGYVAGDPRPTLLFVHHDLGEDDSSLTDAPKLLDLIIPLQQVKAIFYGHTHQYKIGAREGVHLVNIPATAYSFSPDQPTGWMLMTRTPNGVNITLHAQGGNTAPDGAASTLTWR